MKSWKLLFWSWILGIVLCCTPTKNIPARFIEVQQQGHYFHREVYIEPVFNELQIQIIIKSLELWSDSTQGYIRWTLHSWVEPEKLLKNSVECQNILVFFKSQSLDDNVLKVEKKLGKTIAGYANPSSQECSFESIFLVEDRLRPLLKFKQVTLHEIGHILGLHHDRRGHVGSPEPSIMSYQWLWSLDRPTPYDLKWFLKVQHLYYY